MPAVVHLADRDTPAFEAGRLAAHVVCAGDSITGWNNSGTAEAWPFRTYPCFLAQLCEPFGWTVAEVGIAGEVSRSGREHVRAAIALFPAARLFVIGYGTNDLGLWPEVEETSPRIIENLHHMVSDIYDGGGQPILLNVPPANGSKFPPRVADSLRRLRAHHNEHMATYCRERSIPLIDLVFLRDEHFGDELHPNDQGAQLIAREVFQTLAGLRESESGR